MKKIIRIFLSICIVFSLFACGNDDDNTEELGDWWIIQDYDLSEGIPLLVRFKMHDGDDYATSYDLCGQEIEQITVSREDEYITLDLGFTSAKFISDGQYLYNPSNNEIVFYRSDDPQFIEQPNYDGTWYANGDINTTNILKINGNNYELSSDFNSESGSFEYGPTIHIVGQGHEVNTLASLKTEFPGPEFQPMMDGKVLYCLDFMDYSCYVNEDYIDDETALMYVKMLNIFNPNWFSIQENYRLSLTVSPYYFQIMAYAIDENGIENPNRELGAWEGTWEIDTGNNEVIFKYFEGYEDRINLDDDLNSIDLVAIDYSFDRY